LAQTKIIQKLLLSFGGPIVRERLNEHTSTHTHSHISAQTHQQRE